MKAVDPSIKIIAVGDEDPSWNRHSADGDRKRDRHALDSPLPAEGW